MKRRAHSSRRIPNVIAGLIVLCGFVIASPLSQSAETNAAAGRGEVPTHTVKRGSLSARVQLDAALESSEMAPVRLQGKTIAEYSVVEAVAHGARVRKGDSLCKVETEKLREQIEDLELDRPSSALALELAEAELKNLAQTTPLRLEAARRVQRHAIEDLEYFESTGKAAREKSVAFGLKGADQRLEGAREELKQLQKMYAADDLTEETEEIILKRQKFAVESAEYSLEISRQSADQTLKTGVPREYDGLKTARRDSDLAAGYAEETLNRTLAKKRLDVEKMRRDQKKAEKRLQELRQDLQSMEIVAPMDGLVYYGACEDGKWTTGAGLAKRLIAGGKLAAKEVVMTIVNPDKLVLRTTVPEADVAKLKVGMSGEATPVAATDRKLSVKLESLGQVPMPGGGFEARLSIGKVNGVHLAPGMNCKVAFDGGRTADVLLVPKDSVFTVDGAKVVFVAAKSGPEKRVVRTGGADDRMVEIEDGVKAGDKVLLRKPE